MIKLKRMGVTGTPLFKSQTFEFLDGVSYVYGLNKSTALKTNNSNFVGKSRFFGYLSEMLYDIPVVGLKQDRHKEGKRFIEYEFGGHEVKIVSAFATNGRERVTIWVDGEKKSYLTPTKGKAAIAKVWRPSVDDFNAYVYLDSRVPHPLVRGSSIQRKNFFTTFFGLNRIDAERKLFNAELAAVLKVKSAHAELVTSYKSLQKDVLPPQEVQTLRARYTELKAKSNRLQALATRALEVRRLCDFGDSFKGSILQLHKFCFEDINQETFDAAVKDAKWNIQNDTRGLEDARAWDAYKVERDLYAAAIAQLGSDVGSAEDYQPGAERYASVRTRYQVARSKLNDLGEMTLPEVVAKPQGELEDLLVRKANLQASLDHARKFGSGKCHACGQEVKVGDEKQLIAKINRLADLIRKHEFYTAYRNVKLEYREYQAERQELEASVLKYKNLVRKYRPDFDRYEVLKNLVKPKPFKGERLEVSVKEKMLEESRAKLQVLEWCRPHLSTIMDFQALTAKDLKLLKYDQYTLNVIHEEMADIRARLEVHRSVRVQARDLKARMEEMQETLALEEPLRLLIKGYADKAMKKMAIESICARLMTLVNHYGQMYFPGFTFEFVWNTQLSIIAHRPNGEPSDVRKLSGAESLLFTLVLLMSLSSFVPSRKKVSTLILDEPSSSFSEETTRVFHEMLPQLNKIFPSIVIITPKTEEQYEGAHNYTVVRTKDGATIKEGIIQ